MRPLARHSASWAAAFLAVAVFPVAAAGQDHGWDCQRFSNLPQIGINACLADQWRAADEDLNEVYRRLMAELSPADSETLRQAQRAWITFRDAACDVEAGQMRGGSGEPMLRYSCLARLTERRVEDMTHLTVLYE